MDLVKDGYEQIAKSYLDNRDKLKSGKYIYQLLKHLAKNSTILDLGCGAGTPVDDLLLKAGHSVIGIDISPNQIKLARVNCRRATYMVGDIQDLKDYEYSVGAVVSMYTMFHIPRSQHLGMLKKIASFLPRGGMLLITMGDREFEGTHKMHGVEMWSSQYGTANNHKLVEQAGFQIILDEIDLSGGERHQVILAQKFD